LPLVIQFVAPLNFKDTGARRCDQQGCDKGPSPDILGCSAAVLKAAPSILLAASVGHYSIICISYRSRMFLMPVRKALRSKAYAISRQGYQCGVPMPWSKATTDEGCLIRLLRESRFPFHLSFAFTFLFFSFFMLEYGFVIIFFFEVTSGMVVLNSPFDYDVPSYILIVDYKIFSGKQKL
jgi:hypothetical protein